MTLNDVPRLTMWAEIKWMFESFWRSGTAGNTQVGRNVYRANTKATTVSFTNVNIAYKIVINGGVDPNTNKRYTHIYFDESFGDYDFECYPEGENHQLAFDHKKLSLETPRLMMKYGKLTKDGYNFLNKFSWETKGNAIN